MAEPERRSDFEFQLLQELRQTGIDVQAWVVLPNHYHFLAQTERLDFIGIALKQLHGKTAREWNLQDGMTGKRRVWYKFQDESIRDETHYYRALNYIHINPVKHGYVQDPYEWLWMSLENYRDTFGREWLNAQWKSNPPGEFGKGWDL